MVRFLLILIPIAVTVFALFDAIGTPKDNVRSLPKWLWILLIIILWIGGAVLWFFFGRPGRSNNTGRGGGGGQPPPMGPDDDPDFLSKIEWDKRKPKHDS